MVAVINFAVFMASHYTFGGDAITGKVENGHYFLYNKDNTGHHYNEVSYAVFRYCQIQACSLFITHPLAIISGWILSWRRGKQKKKEK